jgi:hypothetical protein
LLGWPTSRNLVAGLIRESTLQIRQDKIGLGQLFER